MNPNRAFYVFDLETVLNPECLPLQATQVTTLDNNGKIIPSPPAKHDFPAAVHWEIVSASFAIYGYDSSPAKAPSFDLLGAGVYDRLTSPESDREIVQSLSDDFKEVLEKDGCLVGFNTRVFDIPVVLARLTNYGLPTSRLLSKQVQYRYDTRSHLDLLDVYSMHGATRAPKLDSLARLIGMPGKADISGSDVATLWKNHELQAISEYCLEDALQTGGVLLRYLFTQGEITLREYQKAMHSTIEHYGFRNLLHSVRTKKLFLEADNTLSPWRIYPHPLAVLYRGSFVGLTAPHRVRSSIGCTSRHALRRCEFLDAAHKS